MEKNINSGLCIWQTLNIHPSSPDMGQGQWEEQDVIVELLFGAALLHILHCAREAHCSLKEGLPQC